MSKYVIQIIKIPGVDDPRSEIETINCVDESAVFKAVDQLPERKQFIIFGPKNASGRRQGISLEDLKEI